ncbi:MAG TPA: hypothetical protein PK329_09680 [Myxococcota bacterium]|nr:MAG: hypothetical protein BWX66_00713 [Deltaproteobacteria bacterium ADurb.Bin058]HOE83215.1 hypothetical protein [Myxococcota bacterium]HON26561.1 hypothetical protein [Myxococcota bacterium]HOS62736.1 hypothetical protein [Myxococcota bacterium]HPL25968.1 hypothetical protein [Myxococcota bacterium]
MSTADNHNSGEVLRPHTKRDFIRAGWVIAFASLMIAGIGVRFFVEKETIGDAILSQNQNAAIMFWIIGVIFLGVAIGILVKAYRGE